MRNMLATLLLSQGVPMILAGDEFARTQAGNNNAYCQDNELSWVSWQLEQEHRELVSYVKRLIEIRRSHPSFHRRSFFQGRPIRGAAVKDVTWLTPNGNEMTDQEWNESFARCLGMFLAGDAIGEEDDRGQPLHDDDFILLLNAHHERIDFVIPGLPVPSIWNVMLDTTRADGGSSDRRTFPAGSRFPLGGRSLALLVKSKNIEITEGVQPAEAAALATLSNEKPDDARL
jgi:glycogen operon protein